MRKALLLIKIALLLATFASFGSVHAAAIADQHSVTSQVSDFALGSPSTSGGDDKKAIAPVTLVILSVSAPEIHVVRQTPILSEANAARPFARAPPAILHV